MLASEGKNAANSNKIFHEITHVRYQIKATLVVNPANMSDFKKAFRRKQTMLLSEDSTSVNKEKKAYFHPAGATQNAQKRRNKNINHAFR